MDVVISLERQDQQTADDIYQRAKETSQNWKEDVSTGDAQTTLLKQQAFRILVFDQM